MEQLIFIIKFKVLYNIKKIYKIDHYYLLFIIYFSQFIS